MKKFKKVKFLLFEFVMAIVFCFIGKSVNAETMFPDEIQGPAYVIGSHIFTREVNKTTGYEGRLTTNLIMLASQTAETSGLNDVIIYYKTSTGNWINGLTGESIQVPTSFEIKYRNLQLEKTNEIISTPKAPIISLHDSPINFDEKSNMLKYELNIYIDDANNTKDKVDGVVLDIVDYNSQKIKQDLKYSDGRFKLISTVPEKYIDNVLEVGKKYHMDFIDFECPTDGYYIITARSYVENSLGERVYSNAVYTSISPDTLSSVEIVNDYSSPEYVSYHDDKYIYKLGIRKPNVHIFNINTNKFSYMVYEKDEKVSKKIGVFGMNELFNVEVPKNSVKTYYAQLGYYDINGNFKYFNEKETEHKYFTIDTRNNITTPVLEIAQIEESSDFDITIGDKIFVDSNIYKNADENSLDYNVKGIEFYQISHDDNDSSDFEFNDPIYGDIDSFFIQVKPINGVANYIARAYAINAAGRKVYSNYSNVVRVIRTPEIEVSNFNGEKVDINIKNIKEYGNYSNLKYKIYNESDIEITELTDLDRKITIDIDSNNEIYMVIYEIIDDKAEVHSAISNRIDLTKIIKEDEDNKLKENLDEIIEDTKFRKPLVKGIISSYYGYKTNPSTNTSFFHSGVDIAGNSEGTNVYATANGVVGQIVRKAVCGGNQIYVYHNINGEQVTSLYMHLLTINVNVGDKITSDTVIGTVGGGKGTSNWDKCSTGAHLHFTLANGWYGKTYTSYENFIKNTYDPKTVLNLSDKVKDWSER